MEQGRAQGAATARVEEGGTRCANGGAVIDGGEGKEEATEEGEKEEATEEGEREEATEEGGAAAAASSTAQAPSVGVIRELLEAAERGKLERLQARCRMWEEKHPDVPASFGTYAWVPTLWTAAHRAASEGRTRVLRWLVEERGVPVHRLTVEEMGLLLCAGAAEACDTPLVSAVEGGHEATALYLLRAGLQRGTIDADQNGDEEGSTVLHVGAMEGISADLMAALVEEGGFDPTTTRCVPVGDETMENETPLAIAAKRGHVHSVDYFLRWARREDLISQAMHFCLDKEMEGVSVFWAAIRNRRLEVVEHVVETVPELDLSNFLYSLEAGD